MSKIIPAPPPPTSSEEGKPKEKPSPPTNVKNGRLILPEDRGKGVTGDSKLSGKKFLYGKIHTKNPITKEPLTIIIHRRNQPSVETFKFASGFVVSFEWKIVKIRGVQYYTAANIEYIRKSDVFYKATSYLDKFPNNDTFTISKDKLMSELVCLQEAHPEITKNVLENKLQTLYNHYLTINKLQLMSNCNGMFIFKRYQ